MKQRVIDIRIEHGPSQFELTTRVVPLHTGGAPAWSPKSRGLTRLIIDMPARSQWKLAIAVAVFEILLGAPIVWGIFRITGESFDPSALLFFGGLIAFSFMIVVIVSGMFARREVVEFDSRYVTVTRGDQLVYWIPRRLCTEIALWTPPPAGPVTMALRRLADIPVFVWGDGQQGWGHAGAGISRESATELIPVIQQFLDEHPPEVEVLES